MQNDGYANQQIGNITMVSTTRFVELMLVITIQTKCRYLIAIRSLYSGQWIPGWERCMYLKYHLGRMHIYFFEYVKPCILNQLLCIFPRSYSLFCPLLHKCLMWVWLEIFLLPHLHLLGSSGFITTLPSILTRWVTRCEKTLLNCRD